MISPIEWGQTSDGLKRPPGHRHGPEFVVDQSVDVEPVPLTSAIFAAGVENLVFFTHAMTDNVCWFAVEMC